MDRHGTDSALEAANVALSGRKNRETSRFASIELRDVDPRTGEWEIAATACVGLATLVFILGVWLY